MHTQYKDFYIYISLYCVCNLKKVYVNLKWKLLIRPAETSLFGCATIWVQTMASLHQMRPTDPHYKKRPLDGKPFAKSVVLETLIKKTKKPNRNCMLVRLSTGKGMVAYVPGIGHNLQEHATVLCYVGRCQDVPGVKIRCVHGKSDLPHIVKKKLFPSLRNK